MTVIQYLHHKDQVAAARLEWAGEWKRIKPEFGQMSEEAFRVAEILEWKQFRDSKVKPLDVFRMP